MYMEARICGYVDMRMSGRMSGRKLSHELMCDLCTTVGLRQLVVLGLAQVCADWVCTDWVCTGMTHEVKLVTLA